jgi:uncharacterized damage-inducible protein DinB
MSLLEHLYRHHKWANLTLIDHLATLNPDDLSRRAPGGFGTIQETLFHFVATEARFLDSLEGRELSAGAMPSGRPSLPAIKEMAAGQADRLIAFAGSIDEASRTKGTFNGQPFDMPSYLLLFQAYNHAVEHRTNITTVLATYDLPTTGLDLWAFQRAGEAP